MKELPDFDPDLLVTIREFTDPIKANFVQSVLTSAGIPALLLDTHGEASFIRCQVPAGDRLDAETILSKMFEDLGQPTTAEGHQVAPASTARPPRPTAFWNGTPGRSSAGKCPDCGSATVDWGPAPDHAREPFLNRLMKRLQGRGWLRCNRCGRTWRS
jgi:hypothetical protein